MSYRPVRDVAIDRLNGVSLSPIWRSAFLNSLAGGDSFV